MKKCKLKNCCSFIDYRGKTPEKSDDGYRIITAKNVKPLGFCDEPKEFIPIESYESVMVRGIPRVGDILFTTEAPLGNVGRIPEFVEPFAVGQRLIVIQPEEELLDYQYMVYKLRSKSFQEEMYKRSSGSTVRGIRSKELVEIEIEFPEIIEQENISKILTNIERIIETRKEELVKLDELVKARFVELFGDPIDNPRGLPVKTLKELSTLITNGNTPKGGSENYIDKGILFLRSQNIWRNRIELDDVAYIDEATHHSLKKSSLKYKDILITKTGRINTENSSLGRAALYLGENDSANINGHVYLVRLDGSVVPEFVVAILISEAYRKYIRKVCVGGIDKRQINLDQVEDFPIILPSIDLQKQFAAFVEQTDKSKVAVQKALDEAQLLFDSLMQKYFE